ncbi:MAG: hypothetical protein N2246_04495, partial [Candidatus Sumerlaeia bacterium]|nr:hypothetical protein [Candidatus Sumerlaeia bacterium]
IFINTTGKKNIAISYKLRDIDASSDNAVSQVALHYRIGESGDYTNVPAGYVADASDGPSLTKETSINVVLPSEVDNKPQVQIRIMTTNAPGNDEWIGIDDISITGEAISEVDSWILY